MQSDVRNYWTTRKTHNLCFPILLDPYLPIVLNRTFKSINVDIYIRTHSSALSPDLQTHVSKFCKDFNVTTAMSCIARDNFAGCNDNHLGSLDSLACPLLTPVLAWAVHVYSMSMDRRWAGEWLPSTSGRIMHSLHIACICTSCRYMVARAAVVYWVYS